MNRPLFLVAALSIVTLAGCGTSPPLRYHTLVGDATTTGSAGRGAARATVEVLPILMPERVNRDEVVLVGTGQGLDVRENDRWAAPLADEMRQIVDDALWRRLHAADVYAAPVAAAGLPRFRLAARVERLDASPGRAAVVEGSWSLRRLPEGDPALCRARFVVALPATDTVAAVAALAQGSAQLAESVADSVQRLAHGMGDVCGTNDSGS